MKSIIIKAKYALAILSFAPALQAAAQGCDIPIRVMSMPQAENIPESTLDMVNNRLASAITAAGTMAPADYGQFFITAKFNHSTEDVVAGPPKQVAVNTTMTLLLGDIEGEQIYASKTFELRGVGTSTQRALANAMKPLNARNPAFEQFVKAGKDKIIAYYDKIYPSILAKADRAASLNKYDEALYYACSIPECCVGYTEASDHVARIFKEYVDRDAEILYKKAYAAWGAAPNEEGAREALAYLSLVEPSSAIYPKCQKLAQEIKNTVRGDYEFENMGKYNDEVSLKRAQIEAARQIGVAYGSGQKESTTNLLWVK